MEWDLDENCGDLLPCMRQLEFTAPECLENWNLRTIKVCITKCSDLSSNPVSLVVDLPLCE